jgi:gluconate 5-dehydrogenase
MAQVFKNLFDLTGRVALVTGGSGGLGGETALAFADYGADVVITSRRKEPLDKMAAEIAEKTGRKVEGIPCDVTKESGVIDLVSSVVKDHGKIDILANFAGMNIPKPAEEYPLEDWKTIIDANATSVMLCSREVGKTMIPRKMGKIINVSSVRGEYALPKNYLGYCATKAAVNMITRQMACEWAKHNILVNAIAPTVVETALTAHLFKDAQFSASLKARIPLGRWAMPADIVGTVLFLASDASNFITGQIIYVDGGVTTW